ncbi:MAG: AMP-binding protein, partial [Deltaproteobacteria bacterium]|nr:AMP-binding protein [Deltaproteobacteria bacterium]
MSTPTELFSAARKLLLELRDDQPRAHAEFRWPDFSPVDGRFNWARDWFDVYAHGNAQAALRILHETDAGPRETTLSYEELSRRSDDVADWLHQRGVARGDRVLLMLGNVAPLWETMLACIKLGAVLVPTSQQCTPDDLADRIVRGQARHALTDEAGVEKFARTPEAKSLSVKLVHGPSRDGWISFDDARAGASRRPDVDTLATDPLLLYFTSGTTAKPKLVLHTHQSYPVGHLSTMYWIGLREREVHQNISSPGWAKHAWSSFFAPWNAGATLVMHDTPRFHAKRELELLREAGVNTLCAPPTVWRMVILEALGDRPPGLRELVSAGEPLNPEVIEQVQRAWGLTVRDGFGQTETSAQIGNAPGQKVKVGSMGRPLPGYAVALLDHEGREANEGEIALKLGAARPVALMDGYLDDPARTAAAMAGGYYRTGDEAARDDDGYYLYVGRGDDVFKSSDYRLSPFELESVLLEHPAVAEAAVVPSPDDLRLSVAKAFVVVKPGLARDREQARQILLFVKEKLAAYKRSRRLEVADLPKTMSGKIRRVQLRAQEKE